ncbi:MAG: hypothetical protein ACLFPJ_00115 [Candidatus Woesearchaeota archaeon]
MSKNLSDLLKIGFISTSLLFMSNCDFKKDENYNSDSNDVSYLDESINTKININREKLLSKSKDDTLENKFLFDLKKSVDNILQDAHYDGSNLFEINNTYKTAINSIDNYIEKPHVSEFIFDGYLNQIKKKEKLFSSIEKEKNKFYTHVNYRKKEELNLENSLKLIDFFNVYQNGFSNEVEFKKIVDYTQGFINQTKITIGLLDGLIENYHKNYENKYNELVKTNIILNQFILEYAKEFLNQINPVLVVEK